MGNMDNGKDAQGSMVAALEVFHHTEGDASWSEQWHASPATLPEVAWDSLVAGQEGGSPFLRCAFLSALHDSGSACPETGWSPQFLTLHDQTGALRAACPLYAKTHSYGEYVFDWAWADAHDRALRSAGLRYYPKLLSAVPFTPVAGPRLCSDQQLPPEARSRWRTRLLQAIEARVAAQGWSSAHVLFPPAQEAVESAPRGWLLREGVQFHWHNRSTGPYQDFDDFLNALHRDKRKKIRQERRKVAEAGVVFKVKEGAQITATDWAFFYRCYAQTYQERGQHPYLTPAFWETAGSALTDHWVLFVAERAQQPIACALLAVDRSHRRAYGRYWGAVDNVSCLHFEACYYQPIEWCIAQGFLDFEGGAQGEHKLARGLEAVPTRSLHWIAQPDFRDAVADFLQRERHHVHSYIDELDDRRPFKYLDDVN